MNNYYVAGIPFSDELYHHGIHGMRHGRRRYQYKDGTLTPEGKIRYGVGQEGKNNSGTSNNPFRTNNDDYSFNLTGGHDIEVEHSPSQKVNYRRIETGLSSQVKSTTSSNGKRFGKEHTGERSSKKRRVVSDNNQSPNKTKDRGAELIRQFVDRQNQNQQNGNSARYGDNYQANEIMSQYGQYYVQQYLQTDEAKKQRKVQNTKRTINDAKEAVSKFAEKTVKSISETVDKVYSAVSSFISKLFRR